MEWLSNCMKFRRIIRTGSLEKITIMPKLFKEPIEKYINARSDRNLE
jgi:hypothetical protein